MKKLIILSMVAVMAGSVCAAADYTNDLAAIKGLPGPAEKLAAAEKILAYTNANEVVIIKAVNLGKLGRHEEALALLEDGTVSKAAAYNRAGDYANAKKEGKRAFRSAKGIKAISALPVLINKRSGATQEEVNALVIEAFSAKGNIAPNKKSAGKRSKNLKKKFLAVDRSLMSGDEYAEFCRAVLKNVELTQDTKAFLSFVRGEYESVK